MLAGQLAGRLAEGGPEYRAGSTLASIVAADLEKVVDTWVQVRVRHLCTGTSTVPSLCKCLPAATVQ